MGFGKKQVLLVGNDGVRLYIVEGKRTSLYADLSQSGGNLSSDLRQVFKNNKAPLILLFDVIEQQYRKETIPKVSFMDKRKVINRKLQIAFPQTQMRAFYPLKHGAKPNEGLVALFAGLAPNLTITQVVDAVLGSEVNVQGAYLLPLESTTLVQTLADKLQKKTKTRGQSRWSILMTYQKTGGLRQIVIKDGELALTRLTPLAVDIHDVQNFTEEMSREFTATLTYLSRFGYVQTDGLDLIVVGTDDICRGLSNYRLPVSNLYCLSLYEAGQVAGLQLSQTQDEAAYGDMLHAAWAGTQRKLLMALQSSVLDRVTTARRYAQVAMFVLILSLGYLGWQVFFLQGDLFKVRKEALDLKSQGITLQSERDALTKKLNTLQYDPEKVRLTLGLYDETDAKNVPVEQVFTHLNNAIPKDQVVLNSLELAPDVGGVLSTVQVAMAPSSEMTPSGPNLGPASPTLVQAAHPRVAITLIIGFPDGTAIEDAAQRTNALVTSLQSNFPGWDVSTKEMVGNLSIDKTVQGVSEQVAQGKIVGRLVKEDTSTIVLKGEVK